MAQGEHTSLPDQDLAGRDVHVWRIPLRQPESAYQQLVGWLSPDERVRAGRFRFEDGRRYFTAARGALRCILAGYLGMHPGAVRFQYGSHGKPALSPGNGRLLRFNVAHSRDLALCAVTRLGEIGVDVEYVTPLANIDCLAGHVLSPAEHAVWDRLPVGQKPPAFYQCWTQKEAYVKALGRGLYQSLTELTVPIPPGVLGYIAGSNGGWEQARGWSVRSFVPEPGYTAAIALQSRDWHLTCRDWPSYET